MTAEKAKKHLELIVIVSGAPVTVKVNSEEPLSHIVREALRESGSVGQPGDQWELRTESGDLLNQTMKCEDAGLKAGDRLTLQPKAGQGG